MAINERLLDTKVSDAGNGGGAGTGNQEEGLILHLDANDVDSYDGDGSVWYDIHAHEYTPTTNVSEHFDTVLYTGSASAQTISETTIGFQPDLVWLKNRDGSYSHRIFDTIRGANERLLPDSTSANSTRAGVYSELSSFSDGFTLEPNNRGVSDSSGDDYVAWCFKAGGAPSGSDKVSIDGTSYSTMTAAGLTDGTEPIDKLSVNTKLGFSIVKYTAPALRVDTVAHGLGETPEMIILKSTSVARNWNVFHKDVGTSKNLHLNTTDAANTSEDWTANSTTFSIQDYSSSADWIAYCFTSKRGVSKVGSYKGTGAAGNKVYTGFEPAFVMVKRTDSAQSWFILDSARNTNNPRTSYLTADRPNAEEESTSIFFNRDGFSFADYSYNDTGSTFIYLAFAAKKSDSLIDDTELELHLDAGDFPQKGETNYSNTPTTWGDKTSNSYDGTITGATFDSELGNWLDFDGSGDSVKVVTDNSPSFVSGTGDITLEGWFKIDNPSTGYAFAVGDNSASGAGIAFGVNPSGNLINVAGGTLKVDDTPLRGIGWFHVAVVYSGTSIKNYIDGELVYSYTTTTKNFNQSDNRLWLGVYHNGAAGLIGQIGQFRMYNKSLAANEIMQNYRFTRNDYPNGFDGDINGATWNSGGYFQFDGSNDYIDITSSSPFGTSDTQSDTLKSFTGWVKLDAGTRAMLYTASSSSNGNDYFSCQVRNTSPYVYIACRSSSSSNQFTMSANSFIPDSNWHHYVFQIDGSERQIYIDGVKRTVTNDNIGSATNSSWVSYPDYDSSVKHDIQRGRAVSPYYGSGKISKVKYYDKPLTQAEITALFNEGQ